MKDFLEKRKERRAKKIDARTPAQQRRRLLVELIFKSIFLFMGLAAILYAIVSIVLGSSLFIPKSADGVLESVKTPTSYSWLSESMRDIKIREWEPRQKIVGIRGVSLDLETNRFSANTWGSTPSATEYISDGQVTLQKNKENEENQRDLLNDACANKEGGAPATESTEDDNAIPASLLAFPSAGEIANLEPKIIDDKSTFLGKRAWQISFEPSAEIIKELLWVPFLDKTTEQNTSLRKDNPWIMSEREREALDAGSFRTRFAYAYVQRESRLLGQIYIRVDIDLGKNIESQYQILAQIEETSSSLKTELQKIDLLPGVSCS